MLLFCLLSIFAQAKPTLAGPAEIRRDSITTFKVVNPPKGPVLWSLSPRPRADQIRRRGAEIDVALPPGRFEVVAVCWDAATSEQTDLSLEITCTEAGPQPPGPTPVPPGPQPNPTPPAPNPPSPSPVMSGLAKVAYDAAHALPAEPRGRGQAISAALLDVSSKIEAGTLSIFSIPSATSAAVKVAAGPHAKAWAPCEAAVVGAMKVLRDQGKLKSLKDLAAAYREIASGFAEASK